MADSGPAMSRASSRKRKAAGSSGASSGASSSNGPPTVIRTNPHPNTLEYQLAVPLEMVFRQIGSAGKPLLTRAEARCFLRINMLASEMDQLSQICIRAFEQRIWCREFGQKLLGRSFNGNTTNKSHPFLRPLIPLLQLRGSVLTDRTLQSYNEEMYRVLTDLQQCSRSLRQFAEHNWTLSESLLDTLGQDYQDIVVNDEKNESNKGAILAVEKRQLSDLEEELCNRIDTLMAQPQLGTTGATEDEGDEGGEDETEQEERKEKELELCESSMVEMCARFWSAQGQSVGNNDNMACTETNGKNGFHPHQDHQEPMFSYPKTFPGLDEGLVKVNNATQGTPTTRYDQSKPQGILPSSADVDEDDDDDDDDDETVLNDREDEIMRDAKVALPNIKENSQHSTHSVVSNHSDEGKAARRRLRPPTQSQVQNAEVLASLFRQG